MRHTTHLNPGEAITHTAGHATITLQRTTTPEPVYTLITIIGAKRADEWSRSYPTETEARAEARRTALAFRTHGTDAAIERRREALTHEIAELHRRASHGFRVAAQLRDAENEHDALLSLADTAMKQQLVKEITAFLAA